MIIKKNILQFSNFNTLKNHNLGYMKMFVIVQNKND